jgi:hypothetical protein
MYFYYFCLFLVSGGINNENSDEVTAGAHPGHSWDDVEQFLLEQEHHTGPPGPMMMMNAHHHHHHPNLHYL